MSTSVRLFDHDYLPKIVHNAWSSFIGDSPVDPSLVRPEIISSWERCHSLEVDPYGKSPAPDLVSEETLEQNRFMLKAAEVHMRRMFELVRGQGYIIMLLDRNGFILRLFGDSKVVSMAEALNVFQGANNSEQSIGTFAPGICIAEEKPVQVHWCEHYRQIYHTWCCSAAPLFNAGGELMGVLDITSVDREEHAPALLNLVELTASAIAAETNYLATQRDYKKIYSYFTAVVDNASDPLVIFDKHDRITHLNDKARALLGVNGRALTGCKASSVISNYSSVKHGVAAGRHLAELSFSTPHKKVSVDANLRMLLSDSSEVLGLVGVLKKENRLPGNAANGTLYGFQDIVHGSPLMTAVISEAKQMAGTEHTVLVQGESGTGKELFAHAIHRYSHRSRGPFVAVNCAALPGELIQSELFGYESGAFTGAAKGGKPGKFELAHGGTLFLDEIGDMPQEAQANLLRVLQEKKITRIGATRSKALDVRIIAATNKVLADEVEAGRFRKDLFYRLSVISLTIPPLRERKEDIWPLVRHFSEKYLAAGLDFDDIMFESKAKSALHGYSWPGNARQLESAVISILARMKNNTVTVNDLPDYAANTGLASTRPADRPILHVVERDAIRTALLQCGGNVSKAAKILGISRATIYRKIQIYGVEVTRF